MIIQYIQHFLNYALNLINYFNFQNKYDLIQEEYKDIINDKNIILENEEDIDKICMKIKKSITLDNFVKKIKKKETYNYPQQKKYDLKDPKLKVKGVKNNNKIKIYYILMVRKKSIRKQRKKNHQKTKKQKSPKKQKN